MYNNIFVFYVVCNYHVVYVMLSLLLQVTYCTNSSPTTNNLLTTIPIKQQKHEHKVLHESGTKITNNSQKKTKKLRRYFITRLLLKNP